MDIITELAEKYTSQCELKEDVDGISMGCRDRRFNLRTSNTEPLLRLNIETRGDSKKLSALLEEFTSVINSR